jgi:NDP-sugar pyrophosphorylase family protein
LRIETPIRQVIILAAGKGTRLDPVTKTIPKPMIEVHGRPILEHLIEYFREHGVFDIIMSVGHLQHIIREHFGNGHEHGVHITFIDNADLPGSAGVLISAEPYLDEHFIVTNSDEFKDLDLHLLIRTHLSSESVGTLGITFVDDPT